MRVQRSAVAVTLLLVLLTQVALAARRTSITLDEPLHITSGYACLVTGDYRLVEEHPPLLKMLQALPLLWADPPLPDPRTLPGWDEANLIVAAQHAVVPYRPIEPLVFAARVPTMLLALLLAALVYRWAADLFGAPAGLLALALCAFDPNVLAHAGVAGTDLGAATAIFAASYVFWRWLRRSGGPIWQRALLAGVVLGMALGVKTTALLLLPVFALLVAVGRPPGRGLRGYALQALAGGALALCVLWATYRFEVGPLPGLFPWPVPAPSHLLPLLKLQEHMREGHSAFLMGQNYHHGVWTYFPIAFALKTPPLTMALLLATSAGLLLRGLGRRRWLRHLPAPGWRAEAALLSLPALYVAASLSSGINIGYRHLLPILPFVYVWVARVGSAGWRLQVGGWRLALMRFLLGVGLAAYAGISLAVFPWHLAYFNLFAGGMDGGYRYLVDSNLDWGQTWIALRDYMDRRGIAEYGLSQYTINDPRAYGLDYTPLPPWPDAPPVLPRRFDPAPGVYAISTTTLQGVVVAEPEMFDYFRHLEPVERVGHAMFVYELQPHPPGGWVAQCTHPVAPLTPEMLAEGLGQPNLRLAYFDCSQSWLYPAGDGWYVLARDDAGWDPAYLQHARLAYEQKRSGAAPPFILYEWFGQPATPGPAPARVHTAPGGWAPAQVEAQGTVLTTPVALEGGLEYLGYTAGRDAVRAGASSTLQTYWRVTQASGQPLSLMTHLLDAGGVPVAVGDGLGVGVEQWRAGDVIVQRHVLAIPTSAAPGTYWLQVGAYTLPDVQRLSILQDGRAVGDRLVVGQVEVRAP